MHTIDLTKRTRFDTTLESEIIRFIQVMQEGGVYANGVLLEMEPPEGKAPAMMHFGSLDTDKLVEFYTRVVLMLADAPAQERLRLNLNGKVN